MYRNSIIIILGLLILFGCRNKDSVKVSQQEDKVAEQMLQGIWVNEDEEDVAFRAKGDSIFYPDTVSQPVKFKIINDTLILEGSNTVKYAIVKQAPHIFQFKNQNGDIIKLTKSENASDALMFSNKAPQALNQNVLIKRDTIVNHANNRYHCYVQINPTTYKVYKSTYNDEGVEVDNIYYDNIIHISIFNGANKLFSRDFHKQDFSHKVPDEFLSQSILSDMVFDKIDNKGIYYNAQLCIPDNPSSYVVSVFIDYQGKLSMVVKN
jgi:hypothetical protein